jgi:hypothetical protein
MIKGAILVGLAGIWCCVGWSRISVSTPSRPASVRASEDGEERVAQQG